MDDVFRQRRVRRQEGRVAVAAQQQVQFVQLAALALPAHPAALRWHCRAGGGAGYGSAARLRRDSAALSLAISARAKAGFRCRPCSARSGCRASPTAARNAARPSCWRDDAPRCCGCSPRHRRASRSATARRPACAPRPARRPCIRSRRSRVGFRNSETTVLKKASAPSLAGTANSTSISDDRGGRTGRRLASAVPATTSSSTVSSEDRHDDAEPAGRRKARLKRRAEGRPVADRLFQFHAGAGRPGRSRHRYACAGSALPSPPEHRRRRYMAGQLDGLFGDLEFGQVGAARQFLDRRAVLVARVEIERGEIGALAQQRVDAADASRTTPSSRRR